MSSTCDPSLCPICGRPNLCPHAMSSGEATPSCWCASLNIPQELLDRIPEAARRKACVCRNCIDDALLSQKAAHGA